MKKVLRYVAHLLRFLLYLFETFPSKEQRYIRITPNDRGRIWFLDRVRKRVFTIFSRGIADSVTADQVFKRAEYDFSVLARSAEISERYNEFVRTNQTPLIIDCGANIGLSAMFFADVFPLARVIAIEPELRNLRLAKKNCRGVENVEFKLAAIGATPGNCEIIDPDAEPNTFEVKRDSGGGIPVVTISSIQSEYQNAELFIVKVDIEGSESDLFSANTGWIETCEVLIIELHDWMFPGSSNSQTFLKTISGYKRDFVSKGENVFSLKN